MISARLGTQIGFGAIARVKAMPSRTSESKLGVVMTGLPNACIVSGRWSSETITKKFGLRAEGGFSAADAQASVDDTQISTAYATSKA